MNAAELIALGVPPVAVDRALAKINAAVLARAADALRQTVESLPAADAVALHASLLPPLGIETAARLARCSRRTITRAIRAGEIRARKGTSGLVFLNRADIIGI